MSESCVAHWSAEQTGNLVVTDQSGNEVHTFPIPPAGEQPGSGLFFGTHWAQYPGTEWQEDPPGQWTRAVFREPR
jgi:hypothetical protein